MKQPTETPPDDFKFYSHPEHQQDRWVIGKVFPGKRDGFFIDAGAGPNGIRNSNSYALETQLSWKGICIEAHPEKYEQVKQNRVCPVEQVALWDEQTELTFTLNIDLSGTSGVVDEMNQPNRNRFYPDGVQCQDIKVQAMPLVELLRKYNAPKFIDYLSMDIEGAEYRALRNFPFDEYRFGCMTIEKGSKDLLKLRQLILSQGYKLVKVKGPDDYWIHPSVDYHFPLSEKLGVSMRNWVQKIKAVGRGEG